jgi:hypothetical protein
VRLQGLVDGCTGHRLTGFPRGGTEEGVAVSLSLLGCRAQFGVAAAAL